MTDHVYKTIKVTGSSNGGVEAAVTRALDKASETLKGLRWFEVSDIRGSVEDGTPIWQVTVEIGFALED